MNNGDVEILVFGKPFIVSRWFVLSTKLNYFIKQNIDIGEEIKREINAYIAKYPLNYYNNSWIKLNIINIDLPSFIKSFLDLINNYYIGESITQFCNLSSLIQFQINRRKNYLLQLERYRTIYMTIVDFLKIEDKFLIETDDWMLSMREIYRVIMENSYDSKYEGRYNYETIIKEQEYINLTSTMRMLERYIFPNILSQTIGNKLLKIRKESKCNDSCDKMLITFRLHSC